MLVTTAPIDAPSGTLFGEPCMISDPAAINSCHGGAGVCHVEGGEPVCRPWCCYHPGTTCTTGENQCPNFGGECRFEPSVEGGAGGFYFCAPRSN
jgi:hypothetical protein